ncbi:unnamed protein product [Clonostachys byssicola]|uniref:Global transcription regulator sge1 n=1 Tax=Clonostachys byssicola TaxID=160290 RepID=A0A9N9UPD3_9HYPO|nr:unnamed protein product [Clonostachys byssicola]
MSSQASPLEPTYFGHISTTKDALILMEACLDGQLSHVPRRPHDRERQDLIRSGYVFIYEEHSSGIKRWTDGVSWSPSRILNNFLIYRELEKPFPPGEKKRALKRPQKKSSNGGISKAQGQSPPDLSSAAFSTTTSHVNVNNLKDPERALIGSLIDSYPFKEGGLIKKTISITYRGVTHHLVSYYSVEDVQENRLQTPSRDPALRHIIPRHEICSSQNFRAPLEEIEYTTDGYIGINGYIATPIPHGFEAPGVMPHPMSNLSYPPGAPAYAVSAPAPLSNIASYHSRGPSDYGTQHSAPTTSSMYGFPSNVFPGYIENGVSPSPLHPGPVTGQTSPGHYHLEGGRSRFASTAGIMQESPRHIPAQEIPRRHSTIEAGQSADMDAFSLSSVPEGRSGAMNNYLSTHSFMSPIQGNGVSEHGTTFPSPPATGHSHQHAGMGLTQPKAEPDTLANGLPASQSFTLDNSWNNIEGLDDTQEDFPQHYFKGSFPPNDHYSEGH